MLDNIIYMNNSWLRKKLLLVGYLTGHGCLAQQRAPILSLQPSSPAALVPAPRGWLVPNSGVAAQRATPPTQAPPRASVSQGPGPLLLLDTRLIIGGNYLAKVNPQDIQSLRIYKKPASTPEPWGELLRYGILSGIIDMTLKKPLRLPSQRLAQLGHRLRAKHATYLLNGLTVTNTKLRIATSAIKEVTVSYTPTGPVISVQVFTQADIPPTPHPPGTIMIRGAAAYYSAK